MKNIPLVSIVIPSYNRRNSCKRLIDSILKSTYKNLEIIVIDDASPDNTSDFLNEVYRGKKNIRIYKNKKNLFAAGAKNEGQNRTKGKYITFIDDDNVVDRYMIAQLVTVLDTNPDIGEAAPVNYDFNHKSRVLLACSTRNMWTTKTTHLRTLSPFKGLHHWQADDSPNAFMVRGEVVRKNKIQFDERYGIMYEESDYAYRIKRLGYKVVVVRSAKIFHDIEESSGSGKSKNYLYHFMDDKRRSFTFARNRIVFHHAFSTKLQNVFIILFWIWFFAAYYLYKFISYNDYGSFSLKQKVLVAWEYVKGTFKGLGIVLLGTGKI